MRRTATPLARLAVLTALGLTLTAAASAQTRVQVEPGFGTLNTAVAASGNDDTIFELQRDGVYTLNGAVTNAGFHLRLEAVGSGTRPPVVQPAATNTGGTPSRSFRVEGDFTARGLYLLGTDDAGGLQGQYIQVFQPDVRVVLDDCVVDYVQFAVVRLEATGATVQMTNSIFRNLIQPGNTGNARLVATRGNATDSVVVKNNTVIGVQGGLVTTRQGTVDYLELDHNTIYGSGNSFFFSGGAALFIDLVVTNNLFVDTVLFGRADGSDEGAFTLESIDGRTVPSRKVIFRNNNYTYSNQGEAYFDAAATASTPRLKRPFYATRDDSVFDELDGSKNNVAEDPLDELLAFETPPDLDGFFDYAQAFYVNGQEENLPSPFIDEDSDPAGIATPASVVEVFPFTLDLSYPTTADSYTAAGGACPLGDLRWFEDDPDVNVQACLDASMNPTDGEGGPFAGPGFEVRVLGNPARSQVALRVDLDAPAALDVRLFDVLGRQVASASETAAVGSTPVALDVSALAPGVYVYRVQAGDDAVRTGRVVVVR